MTHIKAKKKLKSKLLIDYFLIDSLINFRMESNNEQTPVNTESTVVAESTVAVTSNLPKKMIKLQPSDDANKTYEIEYEAACKSSTIKNMLDDLGSDGENIAIPLHNITSAILEKVITYCVYHHENPSDGSNKPENSPDDSNKSAADKSSADISPWDLNFTAIDQAQLFELILAANYLDIKPLLDLTCKTVANMIKGKTPEEIRKQFNIKNDFTPEEEEKVRKENEWCEEK